MVFHVQTTHLIFLPLDLTLLKSQGFLCLLIHSSNVY